MADLFGCDGDIALINNSSVDTRQVVHCDGNLVIVDTATFIQSFDPSQVDPEVMGQMIAVGFVPLVTLYLVVAVAGVLVQVIRKRGSL